MLIVVVWTGLSGCTPNDYPDKQPPHETETEMNDEITKDMEAMDKERAIEDNPQPADFTGIAEALGCMFDPAGCEKKKEAQAQEREMDR